jgi:hypothetical protein
VECGTSARLCGEGARSGSGIARGWVNGAAINVPPPVLGIFKSSGTRLGDTKL